MKSYNDALNISADNNIKPVAGRVKREGVLNKEMGEGHFFSQLAECGTVVEFKERISSIVCQLGFTDFSFTVLHAPPAKSLTTLPDKLREYYLKDGFSNQDLLLEHAAGSNAPIFLSALEQFIASTPFSSERIYRNANHFKLLASLGYHDCYGIPHSFGRNAGRAMLLLFAKDASREEFHRKVEQCQSLLPMIVGAAVYFGFTHFPEHFLDAKFNGQLGITPKPLKMLETVAKEGLLLKDAARKHHISLDTANKHVASAKQALGATTLANAVYLAMVHRLIEGENSDKPKG